MDSKNKKCQSLINHREGEIPPISLTEGCPSRVHVFLSQLLLLVSDLALYSHLKIGAPGTLKVFTGRRGLSLLHDIGLWRSTALCRGMTYTEARLTRSASQALSTLEQEPLLPFNDQEKYSSVSVGNNGAKSYTHSIVSPVVVEVQNPDGPNTLT